MPVIDYAKMMTASKMMKENFLWCLEQLRGNYFIVLYLSIALVSVLYNTNFTVPSQDPFYALSLSFFNGSVDLPMQDWIFGDGYKAVDVIYYQDRVFWPLGPFPALLYAPFVLIGIFPVLGILSLALILFIGWTVYRIARVFGFKINSSLWFSFALLFASPMLGVALGPRIHHLPHLIIVAALCAAFLEYYTRRRFIIIGLLYAIILMTRGTAVLSILFFVLDVLIYSKKNFRQVVRVLTELAAPVFLSLIALLWYNYARFGSWFEFGYGLSFLSEDLSSMRELGLFGLVHVPSNLYYFLLAGPIPVVRPPAQTLVFPYVTFTRWGLGLLYSAPYLFSISWKKMRDSKEILLWIGAAAAAAPVLLYYGIGAWQLGYRYSLDFLPLLFLIFMIKFRGETEIPFRFKFIIVVTFIFNYYLFVNKFLFTDALYFL